MSSEPGHSSAPAPTVASSSSSHSSPRSSMSDVPPDAEPMSRRQSSTRSVGSTSTGLTDDTASTSTLSTAPPPYSEQELDRLAQRAQRRVRTSTYGPEFLKELEKNGLLAGTGDGIGNLKVVTEAKEASAIYHSILNDTPLKGHSAQNILFAVPSQARHAKGKVVDFIYAKTNKKESKLRRLKGERRQKDFLDEEFIGPSSSDFMDKVNAKLEQENQRRIQAPQATPLPAGPSNLQPSPHVSPERDPQPAAGPPIEDPIPLEPPQAPFLNRSLPSNESVISLSAIVPRMPLKVVNPDPSSAAESRRASVAIPENAKSPLGQGLATIEEDEDVLIVYLDQQSPRGRRKHKSSSESRDKDKQEEKPADNEHRSRRPHRRPKRAVSDETVVKRSKSISAPVVKEDLHRKDTHTSSRTADAEGVRRRASHKSSRTVERETLKRNDSNASTHLAPPEPEVHRKDSHRSDKKERKGTWHGNTAGAAPTGVDRRPELDLLQPVAPPSPGHFPRSHSMRMRRSYGSDDDDEEELPLDLLMQALGYTPPPAPPVQYAAPYITVSSPAMSYAQPSLPYPASPYAMSQGTPAQYPAMTPFNSPYVYGGPASAAPSLAPSTPWSTSSPISVAGSASYGYQQQPQLSIYSPHSMAPSLSLPHASSYGGSVAQTPMMRSPFTISTPMLPMSHSPGGHIYTSPYAQNPQVLYSS